MRNIVPVIYLVCLSCQKGISLQPGNEDRPLGLWFYLIHIGSVIWHDTGGTVISVLAVWR